PVSIFLSLIFLSAPSGPGFGFRISRFLRVSGVRVWNFLSSRHRSARTDRKIVEANLLFVCWHPQALVSIFLSLIFLSAPSGCCLGNLWSLEFFQLSALQTARQ